MSFATFVGAKVRIIVYIASDLSKTLRMINKISWTTFILFYNLSSIRIWTQDMLL